MGRRASKANKNIYYLARMQAAEKDPDFSSRENAVCAFSCRRPSTIFSRTLLQAEKAVSVAEKKAERAIQRIRASHKPMNAFNPFGYCP